MSGTSTLVLLLGGLVLLGAGFAAGYVVRDGSGSAPPDLENLQRGDAARDASPARILRSEEGDAGARLDSDLAVKLVPLRRAVEAVPPPSMPQGDGIITGHVRTAAGEPLAGVSIRATPTMPEGLRGADDEEDLTARVHTYVRQEHWRRRAGNEAESGADGTYQIEGLAPGKHHLRARMDGWAVRAQGRGSMAEPNQAVDFEARRQHKVRLQVVLPDGTQPERASVRLQQGSRSTGMSWRRAQPEVNVDPGIYLVSASAGESMEYSSEPTALTVEEDGPPLDLRLDLRGRPVLRGRVLFEDDPRGGLAVVRLVRLRSGEAVDPTLLTPDTRYKTVRPGHGPGPAFTFTDLVPGRYLVGAARDFQSPILAFAEVELGEGPADVELTIPLPEPGEYAVLRVLGPDGKPLNAFETRVGYTSKQGSGSTGARTIGRPNGEWWVLHHGKGGGTQDEGRRWVEVKHHIYGVQRVEYGMTSSPTLEVRFAEPGTLRVRVTGLVGSEYEGQVSVQLIQPGVPRTMRRSESRGQVGADGTCVLTSIQPGSYDLALFLSATRFRSGPPIASKAVTLGAGANEASIPLPTLYEVTFLGLAGQGIVQGGEGRDFFHRMLSPTKDGRAVCKGLPSGTYTVHSGAKRREFALPGPTTIVLE